MARAPIVDPRLRKQIAALEEHIATQKRDLQTLLFDNQRLASSHVALKQELSVARHDLHRLSDSAAAAKASSDTEIRALFDRSARLEDEVRRVDARAEELVVVRSGLVKLAKDRDVLLEKLEKLRAETGKGRGETANCGEIKEEIAFFGKEIERGRAAVEYEKRTNVENLEQSKELEKNLVTMAREVEKLRAQLANADMRAREAAATAKLGVGYNENYGDSGMQHGGDSYTEP